MRGRFCGAPAPRFLSLALLVSVVATLSPSLAQAQATASPYTHATRYDFEGRVVGTISPDPDGAGPLLHAAVRYTYNAQGWLTRVETGQLSGWRPEATKPSLWAGFTVFRRVDTLYDGAGRKLRDTVMVGATPHAVTQYSYDTLDRVVCTAVRMNAAVFASPPPDVCAQGTPQGSFGPDRITKTSYDSAGRIQKIQKGYGTALQQDYVAYSYTPNGKTATVTDANGALAAMSYDGLDRQARWYFPSKTTAGVASTTDFEEYGYDEAGNRTSLRKRDNQTIIYRYDAAGRPELEDAPGGTAGDVYTGYDNRGLQLYARYGSTAGAGITNVYDSLGRLTSSTTDMGGSSWPLSYQWDANGNRTRVTHIDGNYITYDYDGLDRSIGVLENGAVGLVQISYDAQGRRTTTARGGGAVTAYGYDTISRLTSLADDLAGTSGDVTTTFSYNPASQIAVRTRSNDAYVFLDTATVSRAYTVNGLNQYLTGGSASFAYDANGNLTSDGSLNLTYDVENRLVSASGAKTATLTYDPMGRLFSTSGGPAGETRFLYDGDELVMEYTSAGAILRRYVHGTGSDDPLVWYEGSTVSSLTRRYQFADHQGSVTSAADANGSLLAINTYDPWGIPGSTNLGRFQYTGQAWIPELGMYHYKARIYSPTLGRFLQTDPIGYKDQVNLYAYVGNDPTNGTDPTGMYQCEEQKDCKAAAESIKQIREAKAYYSSPQTGSNIARNSAAARVLGRVLDALGSKNDGGVKVQTGQTDNPAALGEFSSEKNTITLNTRNISSAGSTIGSTLAHETQHYRQRNESFSFRAQGEIRPLGIDYLMERARGAVPNGMEMRDYVKGQWVGAYCKLPSKYCSPAFGQVYGIESKKPW